MHDRGCLGLTRNIDRDIVGRGLGMGVEHHRQHHHGRQYQRNGANQTAARALLFR